MIKNRRGGFTLIEMAIVLTIISLIVGGILTGQSLIRDSQLRAVATETSRYIQAVGSFRDKYLALPGDFAGATALWGTATTGSCPTATVNTGTDTVTATCNGNGDGRITNQSLGDVSTLGAESEQFRAWQHLANAGLIDGSYYGVAGTHDAMQAIIGGASANVPASQLTGAGYTLISMLFSEIGTNTVTPHYYQYYNNTNNGANSNINYMHMLQFGAPCNSAVNPPGYKSTLCPIITTSEAVSIDAKLDDGYPSTGKIMGPISTSAYSPNCTNTASPPAYDQTKSGRKCSLLFLLGF